MCIHIRQLKMTQISSVALIFLLSKQCGMTTLRIVIKVSRKLTNEVNRNRILDVARWLNHAQDAN